jgi:hypothetical protein
MDNESIIVSSVESLLSVPLKFLFPADTKFKIFSLNEAKELLNVHLISCEMDCLLQLLLTALRQRCQCKRVIERLRQVCNTSTNNIRTTDELSNDEQQQQQQQQEIMVALQDGTMDVPLSIACRATLPFLISYTNNYCQKQYAYIQRQLSNCFLTLCQSSQRILTFYEQNEAYTDQLQLANSNNYTNLATANTDTNGNTTTASNSSNSLVQLLLQQKQLAGEILHTVHNRIENSLLALDVSTPTYQNNNNNTIISMEQLCQSLQEKYFTENKESHDKHDKLSIITLLSLAESSNGSHENNTNNVLPCTTSNHRKRKRNVGICQDAKNYMKRWKNITMNSSNNWNNFRKNQQQDALLSTSQINAAAVLAQFSTSNICEANI